ncbi:MAG: hypothetical protein ACLU9S_20325 [Oscillospiraceae bacterium]
MVPGTRYTSYVLGDGAISYEDLGVKVPYEMARDPKKNGGEDTLYTRQRKAFAPFGISYEKKSQASLSPTDAELANGTNWCLVHSSETGERAVCLPVALRRSHRHSSPEGVQKLIGCMQASQWWPGSSLLSHTFACRCT